MFIQIKTPRLFEMKTYESNANVPVTCNRKDLRQMNDIKYPGKIKMSNS